MQAVQLVEHAEISRIGRNVDFISPICYNVGIIRFLCGYFLFSEVLGDAKVCTFHRGCPVVFAHDQCDHAKLLWF